MFNFGGFMYKIYSHKRLMCFTFLSPQCHVHGFTVFSCFYWTLLSEYQSAVQHSCGGGISVLQLPVTSGRTAALPPCCGQVRVSQYAKHQAENWSSKRQINISLEPLQIPLNRSGRVVFNHSCNKRSRMLWCKLQVSGVDTHIPL